MNDLIWPDFTQIPSQIAPSVIFNDLSQQAAWNIQGVKITPIPVPHVVDACAYVIESSSGALAFSSCRHTKSAPCRAIQSRKPLAVAERMPFKLAVMTRSMDVDVGARHGLVHLRCVQAH